MSTTGPAGQDPGMRTVLDALAEVILASPEHIVAASILKAGRDVSSVLEGVRWELNYVRQELNGMRVNNSNGNIAGYVNQLANSMGNIDRTLTEMLARSRNNGE